MVTKQEQKPCPVCGKMVSQTGIAGHNKSKFHLDALARRQGQQEPQLEVKQEVQQTKPVLNISKAEVKVKPELKQTTVESVKTTKPVQEQQKQKQLDKEYDGLEWD